MPTGRYAFELIVREEFAAAHQLRNYQGDCERLHGHNFKVELTVRAETLDDRGLAMDFKDLKAALRKVLDSLDHTFLNQQEPFTRENPTSENLARFIYHAVKGMMDVPGVQVHQVTVWESDTAAASYGES